jgi:hypothetical protein
MKKFVIMFIFIFFILGGVHAQMTVSGILDSTVSMGVSAGDTPELSFGIEEYANIRFQSRLREMGSIIGAVNLLAASGSYAADAALVADMGVGFPLPFSSYVAGENFITAIELERLYFRLRGEHIDIDGGLFRLPFGYGQVWGSSDFLNPRNPLKPDARPRAILGTALTWYPIDELKLLGFFSAPRNPFSNKGEGSFLGFSLDKHWDTLSIQGLYSFETPADFSMYGIHRFGFSVKADIEVGLVIDTLYTYNHETGTGIDGLSFSIGADYSFLNGNLIVLVEYLYNGDTSSTALGYGGSLTNNHYLYTGITYRFNDFTNMNFTIISSLNDISVTPLITINHDLFQGAVLTISIRTLFDSDSFNGVFCTVRLRLRF